MPPTGINECSGIVFDLAEYSHYLYHEFVTPFLCRVLKMCTYFLISASQATFSDATDDVYRLNSRTLSLPNIY